MARDETTDIVAAFLIGAALGIGATLLLKDDDETDLQRVLRRLGAVRGRSADALSAARGRGGDVVRAGRRTAGALSEEAADIVAAARDEIHALARQGVKRVRKARSGR